MQSFQPLGYQPALDGIRGIAILSVVAFNLEWGWLPGGFLGVDIFFGLSGFLITTLLVEEWLESGAISVRGFLGRRIRRLLPELLVMVVLVAGASLLIHDGAKARGNLVQGIATLAFLTNWAGILGVATGGAFSHAWSLSVEGHFYLIWSAVMAWVIRVFRGGLGWMAGLALTLGLASWGWRAALWAHDVHWLRLYLGTDTRLDGLFVGAAAGLFRAWSVRNGLWSRWRDIENWWGLLAWLAVVVIALSLVLTDVKSGFTYLFGLPMVSAWTSILVLGVIAAPEGRVAQVLRIPPLAWLGRISYSLYLWHLPVASLLGTQRLVDHGIPPLAAELIRVGLSLAAAILSYRLVGREFARGRRGPIHKHPQGTQVREVS